MVREAPYSDRPPAISVDGDGSVGGGDSLAAGCATNSPAATRLERLERSRLGGLDRRPADEIALADERADVRDGLLLGAFEGDLVGPQAGLRDHGGERLGLERRVEETRWGEVDREAERWLTTGPAVGLDLAGPGENQLDDEAVELDRTVRVDRGLDDGADRLRQHRHVWPEEAFVLVE